MTNGILALFHPFLIGAVVLVLYGLLVRRLADVAQPLRLRLAQIGEETLSMEISREDEHAITLMLDHAYNPIAAIIMAALTPFVGAFSIIVGFWKAYRNRKQKHSSNELMEKKAKILFLFFLSACCANPLFGLVSLFEIFFLVLLLILFLGPSAFAVLAFSIMKSEVRIFSIFSNRAWGYWSRQA